MKQQEEEYIIVSKTAIQKRIKDCDKGISLLQRVVSTSSGKQLEVINTTIAKLYSEKNTLNSLLSQSTPLIPEIEKAFLAGREIGEQYHDTEYTYTESVQQYLKQLKLDI